ncbi:MAG: adenylate kinase [Planctomycetes bacterium]|nr:adenylate kinase [Planctomycetota bacterium]
MTSGTPTNGSHQRRALHLVFLGPPGAGKGTQAARLAQSAGIPHLSTGDMLRHALALATPTGLEAKQYMDRGELVPFPIILRLVRDKLQDPASARGWVLDGFPRNLEQARAFAEMLGELRREITRVLYFKVSDESVIRRLAGRRICRRCQSPYHLEFSPPKSEGICDRCGGELYQRSDDVEAAIRTRLRVYADETDPLVDFYRRAGVLAAIDGEQEIEGVKRAVDAAVAGASPRAG